jgi:hypothetical protein
MTFAAAESVIMTFLDQSAHLTGSVVVITTISRHLIGALATMGAIVGAAPPGERGEVHVLPGHWPPQGYPDGVEQWLEWKRSGFEQPRGTSLGRVVF